MPKAKKITRNCADCGEKLKINIDEKGHYSGGHYVIKMAMPVKGAGENVIVGTSKTLGFPVYKWTGKEKKSECWFCNLCITAEDRLAWLEDRIEKWYGERCPDFEPSCACCDAWSLYDKIKNEKTLRGNFEQEYDKEADKKYIYVKPKAQAQSGEAVELLSLSEYIYLNLGKDRNLLGIEILKARKHTPKVFENLQTKV